jgi:hypothetical protein
MFFVGFSVLIFDFLHFLLVFNGGIRFFHFFLLLEFGFYHFLLVFNIETRFLLAFDYN